MKLDPKRLESISSRLLEKGINLFPRTRAAVRIGIVDTVMFCEGRKVRCEADVVRFQEGCPKIG